MLVQLAFKNSMAYWFPMYISLQMICYLVIYNYIPIPANSTMFLSEFQKVVEFESLNVFGIVRFFDPDFKLERWLNGDDRNKVLTSPD